MIIPMQKYSFLIYHKEYSAFLQELQNIGVLHVIERSTEVTDEISSKYQLLSRFNKIIKFLEKREIEATENSSSEEPLSIIEEITEKQRQVEDLSHQLTALQKESIRVEPWGDFSSELIEKIKNEDYEVKFFIGSKKKFTDDLLSQYNIKVIDDSGAAVYFILIHNQEEEIEIDAEEIDMPERCYSEVKKEIEEVKNKIEHINKDFDKYADEALQLIKDEKDRISTDLEYDKVVLNTTAEAEDKLRILEGWVPDSKTEEILAMLDKNDILYLKERPTREDNVPVLLKNNRFSRLFEPIGKLFSLPSYSELDLTAFFAPFFMLFFGFCLGDAGYGLLFLIGASIYKLKAKKEIKPYLSLIQYLGIATVIFGAISGTLFGINLIESKFAVLDKYNEMFLDPDNMFNLALILGGVQIIFGLAVKAANQTKQFGFAHALATIGWLIILVGIVIYTILTRKGTIPENKAILYGIVGLGGFFILFFSDPTVNVFARVGKGVWDVYSTVTGIFGDLLSYIRLFALGLSSAILGFVINDIAMQILGSSKIVGPIFFVVFLLFGHTLNILISSLGSFVHPMRLTFVEFYKNAGFAGGGKEYKPFSKEKNKS